MVDRDEVIELYEAIIAKFDGVERKGAANPYTSRNGNMFSFVGKEGRVALRLGAQAREQFIKKHQTTLAVAYDTVMKEYVEVPDCVLRNTRQMKKYFGDSVAYANSLKAKPTTRKSAAVQKATAKK